MCFSATASFGVAAVLLPAGAYCVTTAQRIDSKWLPFAVYPIAFSIQQATEGFLWLGVNSGDQAMIAAASRGFLFFSYFFWLAWVPYSAYRLESEPWRRKLFLGLTGIGTLFGLSIFLPSFLTADRLSVELVQHSLEYKTVLIYDGVIDRSVLRAFYALIIVSPLLLSSDQRIRLFGGLIVASLVIANLFFAHALISVWCFFAAVLSIHIVTILAVERRHTLAPA